MKLCFSDSSILRTLPPSGGRFLLPFGHLPTLQAHSSYWPLNNSFSHHSQVTQRKRCFQLDRVFDQAPIPSLAIAKLAFDHPEGVFHFGPNAVFGGAGRCNQSGIKGGACFKQQAPLDQLGVNGGEHFKSQVVGLKQVTESENGALIRQALGARVELGELTKQGHIVQGLLHGRIRQANPLLHEMDSKHCGNGKRRTARFACRRKGLDQASQPLPRHNKIHLVEKLTLTCSLGDKFKSGTGEDGLFHEDIMFESGATMTFAKLP
jgi:hypothetical protein